MGSAWCVSGHWLYQDAQGPVQQWGGKMSLCLCPHDLLPPGRAKELAEVPYPCAQHPRPHPAWGLPPCECRMPLCSPAPASGPLRPQPTTCGCGGLSSPSLSLSLSCSGRPQVFWGGHLERSAGKRLSESARGRLESAQAFLSGFVFVCPESFPCTLDVCVVCDYCIL